MRLFYHQITETLYRRVQKHHPIKKMITKRINLLKIMKKILNKLEQKISITHMIIIDLLPMHHIILIPKRMSQVQVTMKMILIKDQDIKIENIKCLSSFTLVFRNRQ